jgi:thymidylate synthase
MPWWSFVHQTLKQCLLSKYPSLEIGDLKVTIYSAHIYKPHFELVERMLSCDKVTLHHATVKQLAPLDENFDFYYSNFNDFIEIKNSSCVF